MTFCHRGQVKAARIHIRREGEWTVADWIVLADTVPKLEDCHPDGDRLCLVSADVDQDLTFVFTNPALLRFLAEHNMAGNMYVSCVVHPNGEICQHIRQKSFAACSPGLTWQKLCRKDHVIVSTDGVYKVFKDTHAVATVGFLSTHWSVDRTTRRISQTLFSEALICVIAKESCPCYTRVFRALCRAVEVVCGISDLNTRVKQVHMDGRTAIYAAMKQVFVNAVRALDWSHFVAAARRPKMTQLELEAPAFVNIVGTTSCFLFQRQGDLAIGESCVRSLTFFCIVFPPFNPRPGEG